MCATTERHQRSTSIAFSENNDDIHLDSNNTDGSDNNNNSNNNTKTAAAAAATIGIEEGNSNNNNIDVDTSSSFCAEMIMLPSVCEGSSNFAEQMDTFMTCRHPLDLLGTIFHEGDENDDNTCADNHNNHNEGGGGAEEHNNDNNNSVRTSGYHAIPRNCEYCGSNNVDSCHIENNISNNNNTTKKCERPRSFFPREKPPFYPHDDDTTTGSNGYSKWMIKKNIWLSTTINHSNTNNPDADVDTNTDNTINEEREKDEEEHNNNSRSKEDKEFLLEDDETKIIDKGTTKADSSSTANATTRRLAWI